MKNRRRIETKTTIAEAISDAHDEAETLHDEMEEWRGNIEEKFSQTEKYSRVDECANALESIVSNLDSVASDVENGELSKIADHEFTFVSFVPRARGLSRPSRAMLAADGVSAAAEAVSAIAEKIRDEGAPPATSTDMSGLSVETLEEFAGNLTSIVDEFSTLDFPGMFG